MRYYQLLFLSLLLLHFFIFFIYLLLFLFYFHFISFFIILFFYFFTFFIIIVFLPEAGLNMDNKITLFVHLQKFTFMCLIQSQGDHALPIFYYLTIFNVLLSVPLMSFVLANVEFRISSDDILFTSQSLCQFSFQVHIRLLNKGK